MLVTKTYESQNTALTPTQLLATYQILKTMQKKEKCIAFYNSGNHSGASQPHKHIQFLPLNANPPFDEFIEAHKPQNLKAGFQLPLEYSNFTIMIATPPSSAAQLAGYLGNLFMTLLDLMIDHLRRLSLISGSEVTPIRLSQLSYNLIMTTTYMHLVPRTRERFESGETSISLNALAFAGQLLFKNQNDLEELKQFGVFEALTSVAYPAVANGEAELEEDSANPVALGEF